MEEIVNIGLDNDMDLILAHKRTMKLAELCGLSLSAQTTFATAVSEIARSSISRGSRSFLSLGIDLNRSGKQIIATVFDNVDLRVTNPEAIAYAGKLSGNIEFDRDSSQNYTIRLKQRIPFPGTITTNKLEQFKAYFKTEPPMSPYDEIRKKNIQLIDLTNKLRDSENQYRVLTDTLPLMMFAINLKGEVTYSNKWLADHLNASKLTTFAMQSLFHEEDYRTVSRGMENAQAAKTVFRTQARLKHKDTNEYIWHLITILPVRNDQDDVTGSIGFFVDIHAQKLIEETLKDNKELREVQDKLKLYQRELEDKISELNTSNHDLEQFAYIASHDLQEPLRKIKTFTALLEKTLTLNEKEKNYFSKIILSSDRMSSLINNVLDYSRLSKPEEQFIDTDLNIIIENIRFDFELLIQEKNAQLIVESLPTILGIRQQLTQLFSNLISNALKFSTAAPVIRITAQIVNGSASIPGIQAGKLYHEISVTDNGIGFDQQYAEQIFTIFQRLNDSQTYSGTGIGLAMCKKIVVNHGGVILAESNLGEGAVFKIYFPE